MADALWKDKGNASEARKETVMRVLISSIAALLVTVTQVVAAGGSDAEPLSFLTILFMGFGALILVFQIFPALVLFIGMVKGILAPAAKKDKAVAASGTKSE
jgi:hypothetical protein